MIEKAESQRGHRLEILQELRIPCPTYYQWRKICEEKGIEGFHKARSERRIWNQLVAAELERVLAVARFHPELSPRLLAVKIIDEEDFSISESTLYRILKENSLINPKPLEEMPVQKQCRHKTTRPEELWQCEATNLFAVG